MTGRTHNTTQDTTGIGTAGTYYVTVHTYVQEGYVTRPLSCHTYDTAIAKTFDFASLVEYDVLDELTFGITCVGIRHTVTLCGTAVPYSNQTHTTLVGIRNTEVADSVELTVDTTIEWSGLVAHDSVCLIAGLLGHIDVGCQSEAGTQVNLGSIV